MLGGITIGAIAKSVLEVFTAFWKSFVLPYWWVWLVVVVIVAIRVLPGRRR